MSVTALQLNWTGVVFAVSGGSSVSIIHVTSVMFSQGGELIEYSGDNQRYPTVIVNNVSKPKCSITGNDVATLMNIAPGAVGTIYASEPDATGATGGGISWTMLNAVRESGDASGSWGQFAACPATWRSYSSDGSTNPLSFARY